MTTHAFNTDREVDREKIAEALEALRDEWRAGMPVYPARRVLAEIDGLMSGNTPAIDALIENRRIAKTQTNMEFEHD